MEKSLQTTTRNKISSSPGQKDPKLLFNWLEAYFELGDTTAESSRKVKRRDLEHFFKFLEVVLQKDRKTIEVSIWTPRITRLYIDYLKQVEINEKRRWSDRTINRMLAHLKTWAKWLHQKVSFPLGDPTESITALPTASLLDIEKAVTITERARILDAADRLVTTGGISIDRNRYKGKERPKRKTFRPWRNRAIVYLLLETGIRRSAVVSVNREDIEENKRQIPVVEKGKAQKKPRISKEGLQAIIDYINSEEYQKDAKRWNTKALFLTHDTCGHGKGRLRPEAVNRIWKQVCEIAGVKGRTPHSARHGMGRHVMEKTKNLSAVQRQLDHKNIAYSAQYARITSEELDSVLDDR